MLLEHFCNILMRLKQHDLNNRLRGSVWFLAQKLCSNWQIHFWIRIFFFGPEPIHKKEWHISSYILFELSTLCKQLIFSGKCFMFTWVKIQFCSVNLHSITNGFTKSQFLNLLFIQTRCNSRSCSCQTLWEALCLRFYLRAVSRFMKSLTLIKRLVGALSAILHWHYFSLLILCRCLNPTFSPPDVYRPVQTEHGFLPECLQRGHVGAGGAPGHFGESPVQVGPERTQQLPELGERPGLADHRLRPGS